MPPNSSIYVYIMPLLGSIVNEGTVNQMYLKRMEDLRIDNDLTQQDVANILNCQREVYRRYEKGIRELPLSYAVILAKFYKVSLDYLVGLSDQK